MAIRLGERPDRQNRRFDTELLALWATGTAARLVVITGAEPLRQPDGLLALTSRLIALGHRVEIETSGCAAPPGELVAAGPRFIVSPTRCTTGEAMAAFAEVDRAAFLMLARDHADIARLAWLQQRHGLHPIWLATEPELTSTAPAREALTHDWHLAVRLRLT